MTAIIDDFAAIKDALPSPELMPPRDGDAEILALFREWCDLNRSADAIIGDDSDTTAEEEARMCELWDEANRIEEQILTIRPSGAVGLATKLYIWLHEEDDLLRKGDVISLTDNFIQDRPEPDLLAAIVGDVRAFVPEIPQVTHWEEPEWCLKARGRLNYAGRIDDILVDLESGKGAGINPSTRAAASLLRAVAELLRQQP